MSNVKSVDIHGVMPFNAGNDDDLIRLIGSIHLPSVGINIEFGDRIESVKNDNGGQTVMYKFRLYGQEAVSWDFLTNFMEKVKAVGGWIDIEYAVDLEG